MKTYAALRSMVDNPGFAGQRQQARDRLDLAVIDRPLVAIVAQLNRLPYCFTLQSCCGHFLWAGQKDRRNLEPLPRAHPGGQVGYRIAYLALCLERSQAGRLLLKDLDGLRAIDPHYVQVGCADWFWRRQPNSYVLQVEPERFAEQDRATVDFQEALHIEKVRDQVLAALGRLVEVRQGDQA